MSKAAQQWQRFLFYQHHLVAVGPLNRDLQLLDVLVKKGSHGLPFIGDRGPKIVRIGSILSLRSHDHDPAWEEWAKHAKDRLWRLQQNDELVENDELFSTGSIGDYESDTEFASNIHLALSSFVAIAGNRAKSWSGSALNVTYAKFTEDSAKNLFYADPVALWKPDLQRIKLEQPSIRNDGTLDLWVVKEIQYAKEIKISASSNFGAHGGVDLASVAGIPTPLPGGTLQVDATVGKAKDGATENVKGQKVPFAFKAIRLVYQENGDLIAKHSDLGTRRPRMKMKVNPSTFFNADKDPIYHMGGLFAQLPPVEGDDEEEGVLQLLDVVTNDENEGVQLLEVEPTKAQ